MRSLSRVFVTVLRVIVAMFGVIVAMLRVFVAMFGIFVAVFRVFVGMFGVFAGVFRVRLLLLYIPVVFGTVLIYDGILQHAWYARRARFWWFRWWDLRKNKILK